MASGDPCERCGKMPCWCVYTPTTLVAMPLRDDDIDRIAERVIAKMMALYEPPKPREST